MKKIALFSIVAFAALVSCQKDNFNNKASTNEPLVFTASISQDETKTTLDMSISPAKVLWEASDRITITDAASHVATYKLKTGAGSKTATFEFEDGAALDASSTYTATYGEAPAKSQYYSSTGSVPLHMTAPSTSSTDGLCFAADCGVLCTTLTDASHTIMRIEVSDGTNTYKVTAPDGVVNPSAEKFYLVLPAGTYTSLNVYDNANQVSTKTISLDITAGHVRPASSSTLSFVNCTTKGFDGLHAWVQLWADGPKWAETNIGATKETDAGQYFAWGYTNGCVHNGSKWVLASDNTTEKQFNTTDFPDKKTTEFQDAASANWSSDWRIPTAAEFAKIQGLSISYTPKNCITITGKGAYSGNSIVIPFVGNGSGSNLINTTQGWYLTMSPASDSRFYDFNIFFGYTDVATTDKYYGLSARPVRADVAPSYSDGALPGEFSVSNIGKKVYFAKGNLQATYNGSKYTWGFATNQYDCVGDNPGNTSIESQTNGKIVDLFGWVGKSGTLEAYGISTSSSSSGYGTNSGEKLKNDWGVTIGSVWSTLSAAEWEWLLGPTSSPEPGTNCRTSSTINSTPNARWMRCKIEGKEGLIIFPDNFTWPTKAGAPLESSATHINSSIGSFEISYSATQFATLEDAGCAFLPAAGSRNGSTIESVGAVGKYWSSSPFSTDSDRACCASFNNNSIFTSDYDCSRSAGLSVRLVSQY